MTLKIDVIKKFAADMPFRLTDNHIKAVTKMLSTMENSGQLLIEAPTGWGKTYIATLATLIYKHENESRPIIFSAKTHNIIMKIYRIYKKLLNEYTQEIKPIVFLGKEKLCVYSFDRLENQDEYIYALCEQLRRNLLCKHFINHLSNFGKTVEFLKKNWRELDATVFNKERLLDMDDCIYYTIKRSLETFDIIITTYYNIFDKTRLSLDALDYINLPILIIDEVHNLPRYYFNTVVSKVYISDLRIHTRINNLLHKRVRKAEENKINLSKIVDLETLYSLKLLLDSVLREKFYKKQDEKTLASIYRLKLFINKGLTNYDTAELYLDKQNGILYLIPLDELDLLPEILEKFYAVIGLSATLTPFSEFSRLIFGKYVDNIIIKDYPSYLPTPRIIIDYKYTSRYKDRTMSMIERVAKKIYKITMKHGSSAVYAASYELTRFLKRELTRLIELNRVGKEKLMVINSEDLAINTLNLGDSEDTRIILLTSQRGKYSEGIDLPPIFRNVILYGLSIPPPNIEDQLYTKYVLKKAIKKELPTEAQIQSTVLSIVQSVGRVLRKGNKTVNIYFFDWRFKQKTFRKYLPHWFIKLVERGNLSKYPVP